MMKDDTMKIGRYSVEVSNPDKIFFPDKGITKKDLVEYYQQIADTMLYHVRDRPITMQRFPDGINGKEFYHKEVPDYFPDWITQESVVVKGEKKRQHQVVCNNTATLVYLANQACITPHIWLSRADQLNCPDRMLFDLDPPGGDFEPVRDAAAYVHEFFVDLKITVFVMTTGSKGVHIVCPLDQNAEFSRVRDSAQHIAHMLANRHPRSVTTEHRKNKRRGRVFIDYLRNAYAQTSVAPYALRAREHAPVATPVTWHELADKKLTPRSYNINNIFRRLGQVQDPWKGMKRHAISLDRIEERLPGHT